MGCRVRLEMKAETEKKGKRRWQEGSPRSVKGGRRGRNKINLISHPGLQQKQEQRILDRKLENKKLETSTKV